MKKAKRFLDVILIVLCIIMVIVVVVYTSPDRDRFYVRQNVEVVSFNDRVYRLNTELHDRKSNEVKVYWDEGDFHFVDSLEKIRMKEIKVVARNKSRIFNMSIDED